MPGELKESAICAKCFRPVMAVARTWRGSLVDVEFIHDGDNDPSQHHHWRVRDATYELWARAHEEAA